mmetsp:Transcript_20641/g.63756  ORF Transcript_20641/g.63756 Transcript_20641/m.63756 type:complete len:271 (-) Transcript_20641:1126-1938(-)
MPCSGSGGCCRSCACLPKEVLTVQNSLKRSEDSAPHFSHSMLGTAMPAWARPPAATACAHGSLAGAEAVRARPRWAPEAAADDGRLDGDCATGGRPRPACGVRVRSQRSADGAAQRPKPSTSSVRRWSPKCRRDCLKFWVTDSRKLAATSLLPWRLGEAEATTGAEGENSSVLVVSIEEAWELFRHLKPRDCGLLAGSDVLDSFLVISGESSSQGAGGSTGPSTSTIEGAMTQRIRIPQGIKSSRNCGCLCRASQSSRSVTTSPSTPPLR